MSREEVRVERNASREGVGVEKECELRRSASREGESREGVLVEKKCE